jgi:16S rRNA processing protein RimM
MGRVADAYGVRGWVKVAPELGAEETLPRCGEWWIGSGSGSVRAYFVEQAKRHGATVVAKLSGLETREQALELKGERVAVVREALPEPEDGRYYLADLVGLEVVNGEGEPLGVVQRLFSNGAHDVMELAGCGKATRLLPWVPAVVKKVDLAARRIEVEWGADW